MDANLHTESGAGTVNRGAETGRPGGPCAAFGLLLRLGRVAILAGVVLAGTGSLQAQVVRGHLWDSETNTPVVNGVVALFDSVAVVVARTLSNERGEFILRAPGPGAYSLRAMGLGYQSTPSGRLDLVGDEEITADIYLRPQPIQFDPLLVTGERVRGFLEQEGFYDRKERGQGFFLTPEELRRRPPINEVEVLRRAPFLYVNHGWDGDSVVMRRFGEECIPVLLVDGWQANWIPGRTGVVEDWVNFADIIAVEVFRGLGEIPQELPTFATGSVGLNDCGLILVWTVWGEQRAKSRRRD